jgi:DNA-binding NarL/FixJ family response regulator
MAPSPIRVLVADDVPRLRDLMRELLENDGRFAVVGEASDGLEALILADTLRPDVILLDVAMPVMDGLSALPAIRRTTGGARIVVFSGLHHQELATRAVRAGADAFVEKGAPLSELTAALAGPIPPPSDRGAEHLVGRRV